MNRGGAIRLDLRDKPPEAWTDAEADFMMSSAPPEVLERAGVIPCPASLDETRRQPGDEAGPWMCETTWQKGYSLGVCPPKAERLSNLNSK